MAWYLAGDKPLHEPILTTYAITKATWVNALRPEEIHRLLANNLLFFFWRISVGVQMPLLVFILGGTIVNSLAPGRYQLSLRRIIFNINLLIDGRGIFCKIVLRWMSLDLLMKSQHWFRWWLGAVKHQAITWVNVDPELCHLTTSKGQSEINHNPLSVILYLWPISL